MAGEAGAPLGEGECRPSRSTGAPGRNPGHWTHGPAQPSGRPERATAPPAHGARPGRRGTRWPSRIGEPWLTSAFGRTSASLAASPAAPWPRPPTENRRATTENCHRLLERAGALSALCRAVSRARPAGGASTALRTRRLYTWESAAKPRNGSGDHG